MVPLTAGATAAAPDIRETGADKPDRNAGGSPELGVVVATALESIENPCKPRWNDTDTFTGKKVAVAEEAVESEGLVPECVAAPAGRKAVEWLSGGNTRVGKVAVVERLAPAIVEGLGYDAYASTALPRMR